MLLTFVRIRSIQEICHLGKDLVECLAKKSIMKSINDATSINYSTLEKMRKCMGHMQLCSRDLLSEVYGHRNLSTKCGPEGLLFTNSLRFKII